MRGHVKRGPAFPLFHFKWLWSEVYRGLDLVLFGTEFWLGWTNPVYKERGW